MEAHRERDDIMKRMVLIMIIFGLVAIAPLVSAGAGDITITETIAYSGLHPLKDVVDSKATADAKISAVATGLYDIWAKQTFPYKYTSVYGDTITIKKIEVSKDGKRSGYYITATNSKGADIATHSPVWLYDPPIITVVSSVQLTESSVLTTVKEDPQTVVQNILGEVVHSYKLGKPIGDDTTVIYASNDASVCNTSRAVFPVLRNGIGQNVQSNPTAATNGGYTNSNSTPGTDLYIAHCRSDTNFMTGDALADDQILDSATLSAYGYAKVKGIGAIEINSSFIDSEPSPSNHGKSYVAKDYANTTFTRLGDDIPYSSFLTSTSTPNVYTFYSSQLSSISLTENTTIMFDHNVSVTNGNYSAWTSGTSSGFQLRSVAASSGAYKMYLTVVSHAPGGDTTPPLSITNLANITTCNSVNWTWTPPGDADFAGVAVYNNTGSGAWYHNVTTPYDLWTSLSELAPYGIGTHTYDSTGNMNSTWVNQTAYTGACGSAPVAAFSGNKTSIVRGEYVQFTDTSSNTPTAWNWTLGDGNVSSTQSPLFQYNVAGTFDVKLYASNAYGGDWENKTAYITVSEPGSPPVAAFSVDDTTVCYGSSATFTDASTNTPTGWYWEFGEGNTSSSQNPTKTYNVLGAMNVNLKATNAYGSDWENKTGYITVSDCSAPPTICVLGVNCEQRWVRIA